MRFDPYLADIIGAGPGRVVAIRNILAGAYFGIKNATKMCTQRHEGLQEVQLNVSNLHFTFCPIRMEFWRSIAVIFDML